MIEREVEGQVKRAQRPYAKNRRWRRRQIVRQYLAYVTYLFLAIYMVRGVIIPFFQSRGGEASNQTTITTPATNTNGGISTAQTGSDTATTTTTTTNVSSGSVSSASSFLVPGDFGGKGGGANASYTSTGNTGSKGNNSSSKTTVTASVSSSVGAQRGDKILGTVTKQAVSQVPVKGPSDSEKYYVRTAGWHENDYGTWYQLPDGSFYEDGIVEIDGGTYCFDTSGYLVTGWVTTGVKDYFFAEDGTLDPSRKRPMLAFTFDDGPGKYTDRLLDCIEETGAHATFFMLGSCVESYPDIPARMLSLGCEIGNHSWNHPDLTTLSTEDAKKQFDMTNKALRSVAGVEASVCRAPYGSFTDEIIEAVGKPFFMWSLDTLDWSLMDAQLDYESVMNDELQDGTIILMHDIHEPSVEAAIRLFPELIEKGYRLVTVSELAAAKGVVLQPASYTDFWDESLEAGLVAGFVGTDSESNSEEGFVGSDGEEGFVGTEEEDDFVDMESV